MDGHELNLFGQHGTIRDYLHVTDMAAGILAALLHGHPGEVYNIGSSQGLTNQQVLDQLAPFAAIRGLELRIRVLPARSFDVPANVLKNSKIRAETD